MLSVAKATHKQALPAHTPEHYTVAHPTLPGGHSAHPRMANIFVLEMMYNNSVALHFSGVVQRVWCTRNCPNSLVALFQSANIPHHLRSPHIYIYSRTLHVKQRRSYFQRREGHIDEGLFIAGRILVGPGRRAHS